MAVRKSLDYHFIPRRKREPFDHDIVIINSHGRVGTKQLISYDRTIDVSALYDELAEAEADKLQKSRNKET